MGRQTITSFDDDNGFDDQTFFDRVASVRGRAYQRAYARIDDAFKRNDVADLFRPFMKALHALPPETAHRVTLAALKSGWAPRRRVADDHSLPVEALGLTFPNPLGLAAGFDKDAEVMHSMLSFGFGFVEVGSLTPRPQSGNPRPRIFRWPQREAVINRLGFNNHGFAPAKARLENFRARRQGIVGVNVGRNKDSDDAIADYVRGIETFSALADYLVINISSPNTIGLRALQGREALRALLEAVLGARAAQGPRCPPLLVKIAPDLTEAECADIAAVALELKIDGLIVSNTTIARPDDLPPALKSEAGGLSGAPLFERATSVLRTMYRLTEGRLLLIGVGGVSSGAQAYAKIRAGASLVQLYTALIYRGPGLVAEIRRDLAALLARDGYARVADAVGADHRA
jgi:dihydroorotate dehydrogenase